MTPPLMLKRFCTDGFKAARKIYNKPLTIPTGVREMLHMKRGVKESSRFVFETTIPLCNHFWGLKPLRSCVRAMFLSGQHKIIASPFGVIVGIFVDPRCTSNTEEDNQACLLQMHLRWQSQELTNFCHNLDKATLK
ncbi:hypothetical protein VP01_1074g6 [Puccinia sorghi]|uniref:Uncharacterized protein n=1 Tax=Puccinia sorghi TaxID=27349 RepID=A0A0L6VTU7_9BASI|nr:hypothetical protein VP01_1074g6 [Puccinia sorghi]